MQYHNTIPAVFHRRLNRFSAEVYIEDTLTTVHVKNTGRMSELLFEGASVNLCKADNPKRKTAYDLISVYKKNLGWVNIDSQVPNKVMREWLERQDYNYIKAEYTYGKSRLDFYMEKGADHYLVEVKGCTLEIDGIGYFPDAPTERGIRHLEELIQACREDYHTAIAFVIAMNGITQVLPNMQTHPAFGETLQKAIEAGVEVWYIPCQVSADSIQCIL